MREIGEATASVLEAIAAENGFQNVLDSATKPPPEGNAEPTSVRSTPHVRPLAASLRGEGFIQISHICRGWGENPPVSADKNGTLNLTATFTDGALDPTTWGTFSKCKETVGASKIFTNGSIDVNVNLKKGILAGPTAFVSAQLSIGVDEQPPEKHTLDFAACLGKSGECALGSLGLLISLADGRHLSFSFAADNLAATFNASNGTFHCGIDRDACKATCTVPGHDPLEVDNLCLPGSNEP